MHLSLGWTLGTPVLVEGEDRKRHFERVDRRECHTVQIRAVAYSLASLPIETLAVQAADSQQGLPELVPLGFRPYEHYVRFGFAFVHQR
jgi:hypothetical protein